jgi:hypothetical protein
VLLEVDAAPVADLLLVRLIFKGLEIVVSSIDMYIRRISLATLPRYGNYCLPSAGVLHSQNKVIKCAAYGVAQGRGQRHGFININDMYTNDVGKGGVYAYERGEYMPMKLMK